MLDISDKYNYRWLDTFDPKIITSTVSEPTTTSANPSIDTTTTSVTADQQTTGMLGIIIGSVISGAIFIIALISILILYRRKKKSNEMVNNVVVSGDEKDRELNQQTHNEKEKEFTGNIEIISNNDNSYKYTNNDSNTETVLEY